MKMQHREPYGPRPAKTHGASDRKSAYSLRESAPASDACLHPRPLATDAPRSLDARALAGSIPAHIRNGPCPTREQSPKLSWSQ